MKPYLALALVQVCVLALFLYSAFDALGRALGG